MLSQVNVGDKIKFKYTMELDGKKMIRIYEGIYKITGKVILEENHLNQEEFELTSGKKIFYVMINISGENTLSYSYHDNGNNFLPLGYFNSLSLSLDGMNRLKGELIS